jgi:ribose transport system substrate-binding protein
MKIRKTVAVTVAAALVGACGTACSKQEPGSAITDGEDLCGEGVLEAVEDRLAEYTGEPTWEPPGPAFDTSSARGKTIFRIPLTSADTFAQVVKKSSEAAAEAVGVKVVSYTTKGELADWVGGMNAAVNQRADLIILEGSPDPELLRPQLAQAEDAGIPVISTHRYDGAVAKDYLAKIPSLDAIVPSPHRLGGGTLSALYSIKHTKCDLNAVMLSATDVVPSNRLMVEAFEEEIAEYCPDTCKLKVIEQPYAKWATEAQGAISSALNADPTVNMIVPQYDFGVTFAQAAVATTGRSGTTAIVSYNGSAPIMQMVQEGDTAAVADVGEGLEWIGYANIDQALRVLTGNEPLANHNTPVRVWDESNIDEAGTPVSLTEGYGDDYVEGFHSLWGVAN